MTAEKVIEKLRLYMKAADAYDFNQARLGTEWPVPMEAKVAVEPLQENLANAWLVVQFALRDYDNRPK